MKRTLEQLFISSSLILLASCTTFTPQQVDNFLLDYQGYPLDQLITVFGVPTKQVEIDGKYVFEWLKQEEESNSRISIGTGGSSGRMAAGLGLSFPFGGTPDQCILTARSSDKKVVDSLSWSGDSDYCGKFLAPSDPKVTN